MNISNFFREWFGTSQNATFKMEACPNCWGHFEWDNEFKEAAVDLEQDRSAIGRARKTFIRRFVERYLPMPPLKK